MKEMLIAIYWQLHNSYLLNQRELALKYATLLEQEEKNSEVELLEAIGTRHFARYLRICEFMKKDLFIRLGSYGYSTFYESYGDKEQDSKTIKEKDFCRSLWPRQEELKELVGASKKSVIVTELELDPYGRSDFTFYDRENRQAIALEVKMGTAPSSVVSQIDRYLLALELDMISGRYDEVYGFVMAEFFPPYVVQELSRAGIGMILNSNSDLSIVRC